MPLLMLELLGMGTGAPSNARGRVPSNVISPVLSEHAGVEVDAQPLAKVRERALSKAGAPVLSLACMQEPSRVGA